MSSQNEIEPQFETPFIVNSNTTIPFGKFRGKPHSTLLLEENSKYTEWIIKQGPEFRYADSREWLMENISQRSEDVVIKLTKENVEASDIANFKRKLSSLLDKFEFVSMA